MPLPNARSIGQSSFIRRTLVLPLILLALPALFFYITLFRKIINLPFGDDYEILKFLNHLRELHGVGAKLVYTWTAQHNEYKLIFGHSIFALQYLLLGHVSFAGLCVIGDIAILFLAIVLWNMFLPAQMNLSLRLALFVPVSWLLFQLSYGETLNWAEPALQNLYIFVFSFAAFVLLVRDKSYAFPGALLCLVLAIAASGNGFLTAAAGFLMLVRQKRFGRLLSWCAVTAAMICLYAYRYNVMSSQSPQQQSVFSTLRHLKIVYVVAFLGSVGEIGSYVIPHFSRSADSFALGFCLCCVFGYFAFRRKLSSNLAVNGAIVFIFLTAVGVAGIRSDFGPMQSTSSRYRIYSSLLLIFAWYLVCEYWLQHSTKPLRNSWVYRIGFAIAVMMSVAFDIGGYQFISMRNAVTIEGMTLYEHPSPPDSTIGPVFIDAPHPITFPPAFNDMARQLLTESAADGIYRPPAY